MILALWDHMLRLWQYQNNDLHEDDSTRIAQFKIEALDREIERFAARHKDLRRKLHEVQEKHMERREHIQTLQHNNHQCWASLAKMYFEEAENRLNTDTRRSRITSEHTPSRIHVPGIVPPGLFKPFCVRISFAQAQLK
jgi:predicted  nucleic acid-binding Zn-ribbon protein